MAKVKNSYEALAKKADERLAKARERGQQLQLLPDEAGVPVQDVAEGKVGRPKGAQNKGSSELRKWLAAEGYRMPEDQLAKMAGLDSRDPVLVQAMARVEEVLTWAFADAFYKNEKAGTKEARTPSPEQRISLLTSFLAIMERAASSLLPYGTAKASPDVVNQQLVQITMPAAPHEAADPSQSAKDVTPNPRRIMPADVRYKMQQEQALSEASTDDADDDARTDEATN